MSRAATVAGFALLAAAMGALQAVALARRRAWTGGTVLRWLGQTPTGRWLLIAAWLWLGWHLFVRPDHG